MHMQTSVKSRRSVSDSKGRLERPWLSQYPGHICIYFHTWWCKRLSACGDSPSPALYARMERVLICLPSMVLLEQVWEQVDQGVQSLSTQSLEQGTSQGTGSGGGDDEQRFLSTSSPGEKRWQNIRGSKLCQREEGQFDRCKLLFKVKVRITYYTCSPG